MGTVTGPVLAPYTKAPSPSSNLSPDGGPFGGNVYKIRPWVRGEKWPMEEGKTE